MEDKTAEALYAMAKNLADEILGGREMCHAMDDNAIETLCKAAGQNEYPEMAMGPIEELLYYRVKKIYADFRAGFIGDKEGSALKNRAIQNYKEMLAKNEFEKALIRSHAELWVSISNACTAYVKSRTLETADKMYETVYGVKIKKLGC